MGSCNFLRLGDLQWGFLWREENPMEDEATNRISQCIRWTNTEKDMFDAPWKVAIAFDVLAIITIVISTGVVLSMPCATINPFYANVLGVAYVFASIFMVLVFVSVASELCGTQDCNLSFGAGITIGGIVLCLITATSLFTLHPRRPKKRREQPAEQVADEENDSKTHNSHHEEEEHPEGGSEDVVAPEAMEEGNPDRTFETASFEDIPMEEEEEDKDRGKEV